MFSLLVPVFVFAQIEITEIMYDIEGSDSGREWVEIYNNGNGAVDLSDWKFFENGVNHGLSAYSENTKLAAGEYAIIADNAEKFLTDWPNFFGSLFDSSFSLKNSGESISLRDDKLEDIDQITYAAEWGALGNGDSLQKTDNGWVAGPPTPGKVNITVNAEGKNSNVPVVVSDSQETQSQNLPQHTGNNLLGKQHIAARFSAPQFAAVGADTLFEGEAFGLKKEPLRSARFLWNFGDGAVKEGQRILHSFRHPGEYVVVLSVVSGRLSASYRQTITAQPAEINISAIESGSDGFIELFNQGERELDLSRWYLRVGKEYFAMPNDTIILAGRKIAFPAATTGLIVRENYKAALLYPNGRIAASYVEPREAKENMVLSTALDIPRPAHPQTDRFPVSIYGGGGGVDSGDKGAEQAVVVREAVNVSPDQTRQAASALTALDEDNLFGEYAIFKWLLGLVAIIMLGLISFMGLRKKNPIEITILE
jgi:hypothetical protein